MTDPIAKVIALALLGASVMLIVATLSTPAEAGWITDNMPDPAGDYSCE